MHLKDEYSLWLNYSHSTIDNANNYSLIVNKISVLGNSPLIESAVEELERALPILCTSSDDESYRLDIDRESFVHSGLLVCPFSSLPYSICLSSQIIPDNDGYKILSIKLNNTDTIPTTIITSKTDKGVLYGVFAFLRLMQRGLPCNNLNISETPKIELRMLDHWDNPDGSIERGYAGKSIWKWNKLPKKRSSRYIDYARFCASIGLNAVVLNNVNANPCMITKEYLPKIQVLADIFRQYGIKIFLSVDFASPIKLDNLKTADPCNKKVQEWWKDKITEIYSYIPDFGGFLIKADSEGQLGPNAYGRTHSDGANMFSNVLKSHDGIVIWRAFVYGKGQPDRAKNAYSDFKPLDGKFEENVAIQVKNGPIDFQPREPLHPLFGGMNKTTVFMEFQITQEYLGQGNHLVFLAPMWEEYLNWDVNGGSGKKLTIGEVISNSKNKNIDLSGIAGVANIGDNLSWCGSLFHPANWYAFGRLAWDYTLSSEQIAKEWTECTWGNNKTVNDCVMYILMNSWKACVDYMTPLGLNNIMKFNHHYGPDPGSSEGRIDEWRPTYYHKADKIGLGFDRTQSGSNAVCQYRKPVELLFSNIKTCPEKYLLWFHHVPWNYHLSSGRDLKTELVFIYDKGVEEANNLLNKWEELNTNGKLLISEEKYLSVLKKLQTQVHDAKEWRDKCTKYFLSFCDN